MILIQRRIRLAVSLFVATLLLSLPSHRLVTSALAEAPPPAKVSAFGVAGLMHIFTAIRTGSGTTSVQTATTPSTCPSGKCDTEVPAATTMVQSQACSDISGVWNFGESATITCTLAGETETEEIEGSGTVNIVQNGCSVSLPSSDGMPRTGSVSGNQVQLSGLFADPNADGVHYTQNSFTAFGTISNDETRIDLDGSGIATGTWEGMGFSCSGTSTGVFTRLKLERLDGRDFRSGSSITTDPNKLAAAGYPVLGAVTDGVTKLLLRLNVDQPGSVRFSLQGTGIKEQDGVLRSIDGAQAGDTITVNTVATNLGQKAFAIYESPDRFVRAGFKDDEVAVERTLDLDVTFMPSSSTSGSSIPSTIKLVRPPIVMIHGLWSSKHEWDVFQSNLQRTLPGIRMFAADYNATNGSHFSVNEFVPWALIRHARHELLSAGIAMIQADIFGHSMGGLLGRIWAGDGLYRRDDNFNKGDIHKLVTIDSPHFGSFLADNLIVGLAALEIASPITFDLLLKGATASGHPLDQGAVTDLMTNSFAIAFMNDTVIDLPSHAIIGDFQHVDLSLLPGSIGGLFKILKRFGFDTSPDINPGASDLVVSVSSQAGGLTPPASSTFNHHHMAATQSPLVADKVVKELLNSRSDGALFRQGWPMGTVPQSLLSLQSAIQREAIANLATQPGGIRIITPPNGSTVTPGQTVTVTVQPVSGFPLNWVLLIMPGFVRELTSSPFTFDLTIPNNAVGPVTILALGGDAAGALFTSDEITVHVQPNATLQSLSVTPTEFFFPGIGFQQQIVVTGLYSDGIERVITSTGTAYLSSNSNIVSVDANGLMTAKGSGVATVTVSNAGAFATTITVTVEQLVAPLTHTLTVTRAGTGTGTVTSSPPGIGCGLDCSESYAVDTPVTLTATPDPGFTFGGWSGDPDCTDGNVTMITDKTCAATFTLTGAPLTPAAGRQLLDVATLRGPTVTTTTEQRTFLITDPIIAGATYTDSAGACAGVAPAGVKFFAFTLEGQLVLGRNRDTTGGVDSIPIAPSTCHLLRADLDPGALSPGAYNVVFWVKDCTNTYVLVSAFYAIEVLAP